MNKLVFKRMWISIIAIIVLMTSLVGCSDSDTNGDLQGSRFDSNISMVQNGYPALIPDITYKEAYDNFFANPQWRGFKAETGEDVVEFSGECTYYNEEAKVYIQFVINDEETFSMHYAGCTVGDEKFALSEQDFIGLVYTPFETYSQEVLGVDLSRDVQDAFEEIYASIE